MLRPLLHFALIGAVLFVVQRTAAPSAGGEREPIVVAADRIAAAQRAWVADTGREPDAREHAALVDQLIDEEVLVQTGRRLRFHRTDPVVWRRLVENMRFVSTDDRAPTDAELYAEALRLGMDESDLVVRRRLSERVMQAMRRLGRGAEPSDAELREFVAHHPERFTAAPRIRFAQVFLSRERHGDRLAAEAAAVADRLAGLSAAEGIDATLGDPSPFPARVPSSSEHEIAKTFGVELATAVAQAPRGRWSGPLASAFGVHFVFVEESQPSAPRPLEGTRAEALDRTRAKARYGVLREREHDAVVAGVRALRERYAIRIEEPTS